MEGADLPIGGELLGYRIERVLGRGGMGVVYLAEDLRLNRKVALKLLSPALADDERFRRRFLTESRLAASLDHPNIVPIYEAGDAEGGMFISMRYVEGANLKGMLADGPLDPKQTVALVSQIAGALDAAHRRGLVHRDVKPSNVLVDHAAGQGGADHVYLADFGLTKRVAERDTDEPAHLVGTAEYVAPEQIRGDELDGRADVYSLGCVLHACLTGQPPFRGASEAALLYAHLEEEPPAVATRNGGLPQAIDAVVARALAKSPADRFDTAGDLAEAAAASLGLGRRRSRGVLATAIVGTALIAASTAAYVLSRGNASPALPGADSLVRIDPRTDAVTKAGFVGRESSAVAAGGGYVWVTSFRDGSVWRIDSKTGAVRAFSAQGSPAAVAADGHSAVVVNGPGSDSVVALDTSSGASRGVTPLPGDTQTTPVVAAGPQGIWFADAEQRIVAPAATEVNVGGSGGGEIVIPPNLADLGKVYETFDGLAVGEGGVWLAGDVFGRSVWRVDPIAQRLVARIDLPFVPKGIAAGEGAVWVTSLLGDTVSRIDPASNRVTATARVGRGADAVATGLGAVWVANDVDATISRVDPRRVEVTRTIHLDGPPAGVAVAGGRLWVVVRR